MSQKQQMRISRKWIDWAHGPGAEDGQDLASRLVDIANMADGAMLELEDPVLIAEVVSVAELYARPTRGDALYEMGPWWRAQPAKVISEGRAALRQMTCHAQD